MKKHGHYCKICGEYKANEKFSGKGHAAHICKSCASLSPEKQAEQMTVNRLLNLPWRLSKEQISWLKNRMKDKRPEVRALAKEQYEMRFPPKRLEDIEAVLAVLAITHGLRYGNPGFAEPIPELGLRPVARTQEADVRSVLSNSFGFGGNCCSLIFAK